MTVYVIMALGLNVVVGYAGLLDLGYVAFYAAGAYVAGWFATQQFAPHSVHILSVGVPATRCPGIHINVWALLAGGGDLCGACSASSSACRRCACAATTWRSSRSGSARSCPRP